jgi:hypothetical protein
MANPRFKTEGNNEEFGEGISELKRVFSRKLAVPKFKILHLTRDRDGTLSASYYPAENEADTKPEQLGKVAHPLVSELLFLQYLSGDKPSSESTRQAAIKSIAELAN